MAPNEVIVRDGQSFTIPGVHIINWLQEPRLKLSKRHFRRGTDWLYNFVIHTTEGKWPQKVVAEPLSQDIPYNVAAYWRRKAKSGTQFIAVNDTLCQLGLGKRSGLADIWTAHAHATAMDEHGWGIEVVQLADGTIGLQTITTIVVCVPVFCVQMGIQMQTHDLFSNGRKAIDRFRKQDPRTIGWFFHSMTSDQRGRGDAGDHIFNALIENTPTEVFDFARGEDRDIWIPRQKNLGVKADGIPGPMTTRAAEANGFIGGIWALGSTQAHPDTPEAVHPAAGEIMAAAGAPSWREFLCQTFCGDNDDLRYIVRAMELDGTTDWIVSALEGIGDDESRQILDRVNDILRKV